MYAQHAELYDRIYHFRDYAAQADVIRGVLDGLGIARGARILDAACGTGSHLAQLAGDYEVCGFDLFEPMLAVARTKLPTAHLWRADLRDFAVDPPVDAALCLFSAIGYLLDEDALRASARAFAAAVRPGGVLLVEPWIPPDAWQTGRPHLQVGPDDPDLCLARATVAARDGDRAVMDMHWLVARRDQPVQHFVDRHVMWLCPHELLRTIFDEAGFDAQLVPDGFMKDRGLLVGRRRH